MNNILFFRKYFAICEKIASLSWFIPPPPVALLTRLTKRVNTNIENWTNEEFHNWTAAILFEIELREKFRVLVKVYGFFTFFFFSFPRGFAFLFLFSACLCFFFFFLYGISCTNINCRLTKSREIGDCENSIFWHRFFDKWTERERDRMEAKFR